MNDRDRNDIASLLDGLANDDTLSIVPAGERLMERHPKIKDMMERCDWWDVKQEEPKP